MSAHAIVLALLRLAPVQCASFGHSATTMSPAVDAMILPEDFIGAPDCLGESCSAAKVCDAVRAAADAARAGRAEARRSPI
jgi:hypothetical protein